MSDMTPEEWLAHYGVKGMKWGVRQGRGTTGLTRHRGAKLDQNARTRKMVKNMQSGKSHRATVAIASKVLGKDQVKRNLNRAIKDLNEQDKRLKSGKLTILDRLDLYRNVSVLELGVSIRPKD